MKKILIIEDDEIVANIYRNKLAVQGFQVEVANTGETGLDLIRSFRPDAVVLDLVLPKLSGIELMKLVRADPDFAKLPMVVFSNTYLTSMVQEAWKAGATKCLSKATCTPRQVIETLRSVLETVGAATDQSPPPTVCTNPVAPLQSAALAPAPELAPVALLESAPTSTAPCPATPSAPIFDMEFEVDVRGTFATTLPEILNSLRTGLKALARSDKDSSRTLTIQELARHARTLTSTANVAGFAPVAQLAEAFEAMLLDLREKPASITPSTQRTAASAVDCLGFLLDRGKAAKQLDVSSAKILVVDDDAISRQAVRQALEKVKVKSTAVEDPNDGYQLLTQDMFDLIFLDVDMPGMNGYELCTKLRALPRYKTTPVVFVTGLNDFEARACSTMSGGNDFIAKPFHFMELAVKAIIYILRRKVAVPN